MNEADKQRVLQRYQERLQRCGATIQALASGTEERRSQRFEVLCDTGIRSGDRVLDLGCGFGDFLDHCRSRGLDLDYVGIDINPDLIALARQRHPGVAFEVRDIQNETMGPVDYVVSTSCFNLRLEHEDNYAFVEDILRRCYSLARCGVAVDFLTEYVDFRGSSEAFYYSPERLFTIAKGITKRVCLRHDYPLFEFCLYL
jgi:SAM-dependent methyltransferase